jgi:hypothetical protein
MTKWTDHCKAYAQQHGITYKEALTQGKSSYYGKAYIREHGCDPQEGGKLNTAKLLKAGAKLSKNKEVAKLKDQALEQGMNYVLDQSDLNEGQKKLIKRTAKKAVNKKIDDLAGGSLSEAYTQYLAEQEGAGFKKAFSKKNLNMASKIGAKALKQGNALSNAMGYDDLDDMLIEGVVSNTIGRVDPTGGVATSLLEKELQKQSDKQIEKRGGSFVKIGGSMKKHTCAHCGCDSGLIVSGGEGEGKVWIDTTRYVW